MLFDKISMAMLELLHAGINAAMERGGVIMETRLLNTNTNTHTKMYSILSVWDKTHRSSINVLISSDILMLFIDYVIFYVCGKRLISWLPTQQYTLVSIDNLPLVTNQVFTTHKLIWN